MDKTERHIGIALASIGIGVEVLIGVLQLATNKLPAWALWSGGLTGAGLIVGGSALGILAAKRKLPNRLIPFVWIGFSGPTVRDAVVLFVKGAHLRSDLQRAFHALNNEMPTPTPAELRAFADNVMRRLQNEGYDVSAKQVEVVLPDNASRQAIQKRRSEVHRALLHILLWDDLK